MIADYHHWCSLQVVDEFTYLGSTVLRNLLLNLELNRCIGKAATAMAMLSKRVWENMKLTTNTKTAVYRAYRLSTLWQEKMDHLHLPKALPEHFPAQMPGSDAQHILEGPCSKQGCIGPSWTNKHVHPPHTEATSLAWSHPPHGRCILKDFLYGELASGSCPAGRPQLCYNDFCKRNLKSADIHLDAWEHCSRL